MKKLFCEVDDDVHTEFKVYTVRHHSSVQRVLSDFVKKTVEEAKKEDA